MSKIGKIDNPDEAFSDVERRSIREAIAERVVADQRGVERAKAHTQREQRLSKAKERRIDEAKEVTSRRYKASQEADGQIQSHVRAAQRSLLAALRAATDVAIPRHSGGGRAQARIVKTLEESLVALRRVERTPLANLDGDVA